MIGDDQWIKTTNSTHFDDDRHAEYTIVIWSENLKVDGKISVIIFMMHSKPVRLLYSNTVFVRFVRMFSYQLSH